MPRRPRPAHRPPPRSSHAVEQKVTAVPSRPQHRPNFQQRSPSQTTETSSQNLHNSEASDTNSGNTSCLELGSEKEVTEGDVIVDLDAPRISIWEEDDWQANHDSDRSDVDPEDHDLRNSAIQDIESSSKHLLSLQHDLASIPFGTLRKVQTAQKKNPLHTTLSMEDADSESEDTDERVGADKPEWKTNLRTDLAKRSSKHAPMELPSKRPVSRRRVVVDIKGPLARDPRFLDFAGKYSEEKFKQGFSFLSEVHISELNVLRENIKRARKMVLSSPRDQRSEWEAEVARLERALKRSESVVNRDKSEKVDRDALNKIAQDEKEKRAQGKGRWFMKDAAKRVVLARARFDALASSGGKGAVKKAIIKKQKKIAQKEKKSRPFTRLKDGQMAKRPLTEQDSGWSRKRRKT